MKKYIFVVVVLSMVVVASDGQVGYYGCTGTISGLLIQNDGLVAVGGPGGLPWALALCQVGVASSGHGWSSESCKAAYAKLQTAQLTGQSVTIWFNTDGFTCSTQPAWNLNNKAYAVSN